MVVYSFVPEPLDRIVQDPTVVERQLGALLDGVPEGVQLLEVDVADSRFLL